MVQFNKSKIINKQQNIIQNTYNWPCNIQLTGINKINNLPETKNKKN